MAPRLRLLLLCAALSLVAAAPVGAADSTPATTPSPPAAAPPSSPITFAIADDAAQRAFPSELTSAHDVGIGAARAYVGWADIAASRPAKPRDPADPAYDWSQTDADMARYGAAGLAVWIAFWQTPAWASGSSDTAVWPADPADLEDFAFAVAKRYPQVTVFMDWNEPNLKLYAKPNTIAAYEPMARAVYARREGRPPGRRGDRRQPRALPRQRPRSGRLGDGAARGRRPDGRVRHPPLPRRGEAARRIARPARGSTCSTCRRSRASSGVPVAVTEFGWSSQLAGPGEPGDLDRAGDRRRPLHAGALPVRLLGLPRPSRARRARRPIPG